MNLPKVFQNRNIGNINNDQEYFYSLNGNKNVPEKKRIDVDSKISNIFKSNKFIYKMNVSIQTKNNTFDTVIIGKVNNSLITIDNDLIPIKDIVDINEK